MKRLIAIAFVWLGCGMAWVILGSTLLARSGEMSSGLDWEVQRLWGPELSQLPPKASHQVEKTVHETVTRHELGLPVTSIVERKTQRTVPVEVAASDLRVRLDLEHRRKGLVWFPTYTVEFEGGYAFANQEDEAINLQMTFPLEHRSLVYDGFEVYDSSGEVVDVELERGAATWWAAVGPGESLSFEVRYTSRGVRTWHYGNPDRGLVDGQGRVRNFRLVVETDFEDVDFPVGTLSPTEHGPTEEGWRGEWRFETLITGSPIGIELPQLLNPGPLASKITFFAPISLLFFFFVVGILAMARNKSLHPMHYFFLGCAFFAFHLLFAYMVDHVSISLAFAAAALVSLLLVVSYARLFVGWRFALVEMGLSQIIYLILFSFTFFWSGITGLAVTIGAIVTLFVIMQMTGKVQWGRVRPSTSEGSGVAAPV